MLYFCGMSRQELIENIKNRASFLCVGLDTDLRKLPASLPRNAEGMLEFNRAIIEATSEYCVAYKPNTAFYEALGSEGWKVLEESIRLIPKDKLVIADAKRGDIGNTSGLYARAFFGHLQCDAITVAPYMGYDSISPFLDFSGKWTILLALTSNDGSRDFQMLGCPDIPLYKTLIKKAMQWGDADRLMFVVGATREEELKAVRSLAPQHFFLVPGIGAQGGNLRRVCELAMTDDIALLVNASRSIIYASAGSDYAAAAGHAAKKLQEEMASILEMRGIL